MEAAMTTETGWRLGEERKAQMIEQAAREKQEDLGGEMAEEIEAKTRFYRIGCQLARLGRCGVGFSDTHDPIQAIATLATTDGGRTTGYAVALYEEILAKLLEPVAEPEKKP
jgi:hypothetical protein